MKKYRMKRLAAMLLATVLMTVSACGASQQKAEPAAQEVAEPAAQEAAEPAAQKAAEPAGQEAAEPAAQEATEPAAQEEAEPAAQATAQEASESAAAETAEGIPYWTENSEVAASIISFVEAVTDESSENFVPEEDRIAVFDFDGTLYGELYPSYFDTCLMMHRALHDDTYEAPEKIKEYAQQLENALNNYQPEPDSKLSTAQCTAEMFKGMSLEDYCAYVRNFMQERAYGFEGMTYADGFYKPMTAVVQYLAENGFTVFISSGSERAMVRELIKGKLDTWIPSYRVIGSTFSLEATGQGSTDGRKYTYKADDQVLMEGNLVVKNQKANKVFSIVNEIGKAPILVFGNSSGDLAMAQYALQHGGKGYMLLCDDTERDYGKLDVAESFAADCAKMGLETVSMKNDFATIYGENVVKIDEKSQGEAVTAGATSQEEPAEEAPAEEEPAAEAPVEEAPQGEQGESPQEEQSEELPQEEEQELAPAA